MSTITCVILVKNTEDEKRYKKEQGYFRESTEASKTAVEISAILTGGITDAAAAETLLSEKKADMMASDGLSLQILPGRNGRWTKSSDMSCFEYYVHEC